MPGMYLRECLIENVGPIKFSDLSLDVDDTGNPKPIILVGKNGTGKTTVLAYILDALAELAKTQFRDAVVGQTLGNVPYLKMISGGDVRSLSGSSLTLLEFSDTDKQFTYIEKINLIKPDEYAKKLRGRFEATKPWPSDVRLHKNATGDGELIKTFFEKGSVCFFPSSRHERPHWLNVGAVDDQPVFNDELRLGGMLNKPLVVESTAVRNQMWLMDVMLDSLMDWEVLETEPTSVDQAGKVKVNLLGNLSDKKLLKIGRQNVEHLLHSVLEDDKAKFLLNYRNALHGRLAIQSGNGITVPSLAHLSAGQSLLFNLFATIILYADRGDINKSFQLSDIVGIVLIDEIDAHLHTDLQFEVLPRLIKLFPKVQFIVTSHAPLFLLGMKEEFGEDGIQILEMPTGRQIGTERFEEFRRTFEHYRHTRAFEDEVERQVLTTSKPLVLTEGKTDTAFIRTALELLGHTDLLDALEIDEVGNSSQGGTKEGGHTSLDAARKFLDNNRERFPRWVLLLYDSDTKKAPENIGNIIVRSVPDNHSNAEVTKGIENLLPANLFEDRERFYEQRIIPTGDGGEKVFVTLRKTEFCDWICKQRRQREDFQYFDSLLVPILRGFLELSCGSDNSQPPNPVVEEVK